MSIHQHQYDVCLSFAGEQRAYVQNVADVLTENGLRVFYDRYEQANLWGRDLYEHLDEVYRKRAKYCILFISADYARKVWTNHERKSAQARALEDSGEYVLPARFDDTEIPGVRPTIGYIDLRLVTPSRLAELVREKFAAPGGSWDDSERGTDEYLPERVPFTAEEQSRLIQARSPGWEHLLFGSVLLRGKDALKDKRRDHTLRYARSVRQISDDSDAATFIGNATDAAQKITGNLMKVLDREAQDWAFGAPGVTGDVENIIHLGNRFIQSYEDMLDWAADLRGTSTSRNMERAFELVAQFIDTPIRQVEAFIDQFAESLAGVSKRLANGETVQLALTLTLSIEDGLVDKYSKELKKAARRRR
jgi:hypothetical protein